MQGHQKEPKSQWYQIQSFANAPQMPLSSHPFSLILAHQNRTIAIVVDIRLDRAKSPEIPQKQGAPGLEIAARSRKSRASFHRTLKSQCGIALPFLGNRQRFLGSAMGIAIANRKNRCDCGAQKSLILSPLFPIQAPQNPKYPPPQNEEFYGHGFFLQKKTQFFPGVHKIGAPISGPRIADKNLTDLRIFLKISRDEGGRLNQGAGVVVFPRAGLPLQNHGNTTTPPPPREYHDPPPHTGLQWAPPRGRQLYFTFQVLQTLYSKRHKHPFSP